MKSKGNGKPEQCAANLLKIIRGEVPYERLKGLNADLIDMPGSAAMQEVGPEIEWLIETYEPRLNFDGAGIESLDVLNAHFDINVDLKDAGGNE